MSHLPPYQRGYLTTVDGIDYISFHPISEDSCHSVITPIEVYFLLSEDVDCVKSESNVSKEDRDKAGKLVDEGLENLVFNLVFGKKSS